MRKSRKPAKQDPLFVEMTQWNPMNPEDRAKYDDAVFKKVLTKNPDAARAKYDFKVGSKGNLTVCRYPLSTLVALGASKDTVKLAIRANKEALGPQMNANRSNALHTACLFNSDVAVIEYIHRKYPEGIQETTNFVYLPLHNACETGSATTEPCSLEMIQFLVEAYPDALMAINKLGDTPLRTAQRNDYIRKEALEYLKRETDNIFSQRENQHLKEEVEARQSWGGPQKGGVAAVSELDSETEHTTEISSSEFSLNGSKHSMGTSLPDLEEMAPDYLPMTMRSPQARPHELRRATMGF